MVDLKADVEPRQLTETFFPHLDEHGVTARSRGLQILIALIELGIKDDPVTLPDLRSRLLQKEPDTSVEIRGLRTSITALIEKGAWLKHRQARGCAAVAHRRPSQKILESTAAPFREATKEVTLRLLCKAAHVFDDQFYFTSDELASFSLSRKAIQVPRTAPRDPRRLKSILEDLEKEGFIEMLGCSDGNNLIRTAREAHEKGRVANPVSGKNLTLLKFANDTFELICKSCFVKTTAISDFTTQTVFDGFEDRRRAQGDDLVSRAIGVAFRTLEDSGLIEQVPMERTGLFGVTNKGVLYAWSKGNLLE